MIKRKTKTDYDKPTHDDLIKVKEIINLKQMTSQDVKIMEALIKKLYDDGCHVCGHCPAQIKFAHRNLMKWFNNNKWNNYNLKELREMFPDIKATSREEFIKKIQ